MMTRVPVIMRGRQLHQSTKPQKPQTSNPKPTDPTPETSNQAQESKEQTAQEQTQSIQPTPTPIIDQNPLNPATKFHFQDF